MPGDRIERPERLVHQQQVRLDGQRACDPDPLALPNQVNPIMSDLFRNHFRNCAAFALVTTSSPT